MLDLISIETVKARLMAVRGEPSLLDRDVAAFYGVETKRVMEAVKNNRDKFPDGYMFELSKEEIASLRSKISSFDVVMPDLDTVETESSLELNFFIGKLKHTVRRIKRAEPVKSA